MAEPLPTLIKLAESKVENVQRVIASLLDGVAAIDAEIARLLADMARGGEVARQADVVEIYQQAGAYVGRVKAEEALLNAKKAELLADLETQRQALAGHFAEQKRYEVLWARKQQALKRAHEARQQRELDEVAGVQDWRRRNGQ
jgi:flagellar biosynthesis chaperone FliJ